MSNVSKYDVSKVGFSTNYLGSHFNKTILSLILCCSPAAVS